MTSSSEPAPHALSLPGAEPLRLTQETVMAFPLDAGIGPGWLSLSSLVGQETPGSICRRSFELHGVDGIDPEELGLRNSPKYGLSRQAWSKSAHGVVRHSLLLPPGASISGITLSGKNSQPADVFIRLRQPRVVAVHAAD